MLECAIILLLFVVITIINYVPVIYHYVKMKGYEKKLNKEIKELPNLYSGCRMITTDRLGEDLVQERNAISFLRAHKNQDFGIESALELLNNF